MVTPVEAGHLPVVRLGGGRVLLGGSALADVVRALDAAQHVTSRDGYGPDRRWRALLSHLRGELSEGLRASPAGSEELPPSGSRRGSLTEPVSTAEVADLLGCSTRNVRDLHSRSVLTSGRLVGARLLFERDEITAEQLRRREARPLTNHTTERQEPGERQPGE